MPVKVLLQCNLPECHSRECGNPEDVIMKSTFNMQAGRLRSMAGFPRARE